MYNKRIKPFYEEELLHDVMYYARGRGGITESKLFELAYPMIVGVDGDYNQHIPNNALQASQVLDSIKRIFELNRINVVADPIKYFEIEDSYDYYVITRADAYTAKMIKNSEIAIEPKKLKLKFENEIPVDLSLLIDMYGLNDGIIKPRASNLDDYFKNRRWQKALNEVCALRTIYDAYTGGKFLEYEQE